MRKNILKDKNGHVYFYINNNPYIPDGLKIVKIGESSRGSTDIDRVNEINNYQPFSGYLFHSIFCKDSKKAESLLKELFFEKKTRGEWFLLTENDLYLIKNEEFPLKIKEAIKGVSDLTNPFYYNQSRRKKDISLYSIPKSFLFNSKNLSLIERRLMHLLFLKTYQKKREKFLFTKAEYRKIAEVKGNMYRILHNSIKSLEKKSFFPCSRGVKVDYVDFAEYYDGYWKMRLSQELFMSTKNVEPFLNIKEVLILPSLYSLRLYELLKYNNCDYFGFKINVNLLRSILTDNSKNSGYQSYSNLKNRVLKPALEKINETLNQSYKMEEIKKGRAVYWINIIKTY